MKASRLLAGIATLALLSAPVTGQAQIETNWASVGNVVASLTVPVTLNPCLDGCIGSKGNSPKAQLPARPANHATPSLRYMATPTLKQRTLAGLLDRVRPGNPAAAQAVQTAFAQNDYGRIYEGIAGPYGMAGDDAANAVTAYLVLGWLIANGQSDVPGGRNVVLATRAQVAQRLASNPQLTGANAPTLGEEMKILFVIAHAGWQGAMKDGQLQVFSDGVERQFQQQFGIDLRRSRIDAAGLHPA